jgi:uncharacterized protein YaeQ
MLYRFHIEFSNIDRGIYESLDFRLAQHPSESLPYLLTRALAFCLSYQENLEFSAKGLGDPDGPALQVQGVNGPIDIWIEIGNPTARKLHKANKIARQLIIYTYKSVDVLIADLKGNDVHKAHEIQIYGLDPKVLLELEKVLEKNNKWAVMVQDGRLSIEVGGNSFSFELKKRTTKD